MNSLRLLASVGVSIATPPGLNRIVIVKMPIGINNTRQNESASYRRSIATFPLLAGYDILQCCCTIVRGVNKNINIASQHCVCTTDECGLELLTIRSSDCVEESQRICILRSITRFDQLARSENLLVTDEC